MFRQGQDPNGKKSLSLNNESNKILWKCTQPNCQGFVSRTDHKCSMCKKPFSFPNTLTSISKGESLNGTTNDTLPVKRPRTISDSHLVPLNIFSIGRSGIFDGRSEDCCITSSSILCRVKVEGVWTSLSIHANDIETLVFCETLQVLFLKPYDSYKSQLSDCLKLRDFVLPNVKWLVYVFREPATSEPPYVTVSNLEGLANKVERIGVCDMQCSSEKAREILSSCGLRLPRSELKRTDRGGSTEPSSIVNRIVQDQASADSHYSVEPSSSQTVKHVNEGGLLTNVINTLTNNGYQLKMNSGSGTQESNVNCRGNSETNELDEECDDLIIIHEENTSNLTTAQPPSDNVPAESTTNGDEESFKFDYKPAGSIDGITLTECDLECLKPGALINDAIINFYLKYLYFEQLTDFQRQATHVFNVFFYSRLTAAAAGGGGNVSSSSVDTHNSTVTEATTTEMILARHASVAKWTRRVDLFSKDYIIIPINESSHWFVALVCYPWMAGMVSYTALYDEEVYHLCQLTEEFTDVDNIEFSGDAHSLNIGEEVIQRLPTDFQGEAFDRWRRKRLAWLRKCGINAMPCILLFDSYPTQTRITNLHTIRNYLQAEWITRRSREDGLLHFDKDTIRGFSPRVPIQSNLVDCGIFLLHYIEMFFKKPVQSYTKQYFQNEMASWFPGSTVSEKRTLIHDLMVRLRDSVVSE
ncbi:unnamed protein product [Trichobilharzia szidati]|nr:unnamed protein product [Trichobilharzia szidati]